MATSHNRSSGVLEFVLICFPGIESWQHWLSIPIALLFLVVLTANTSLIITIYSSPRLHKPMYYLLLLLSSVDLLMSLTIAPKALAVLWFDKKTISPFACFSQIFILYSSRGLESSIFICLAYDRYVAICHPLHHSSIITSKRTTQAVALSLICNTVLYLPYPLLAARLQYCAETIPHCLCENVPLAKLACESILANHIYPMVILTTLLMFLSLSLAFSYSMILRAVLRLGTPGAARKAFSTCTAHLILVCLFYCTIILIPISNRVEQFIPRSAHVVLRLCEHLLLPALNPLVYGIRTNDIRQEIPMLFRRMTFSMLNTNPKNNNK
ncbi:olfactory receptor 56A4-like [Pleurodeles waltl]|uniref:olfactory receptor 56A4-like n=1 Tax=Pleurodeles waltl TaxID=8319 RepID=UPI003709BE09